MTTSQLSKITFYENGGLHDETHELIAEEPLAIRIEGKPYAVVMRTPGDETYHAAGFCLAEGIIDTPDDIKTIGLCDDGDTNVITVTLEHDRKSKVSALLERKGFVSQTSCGICGKELINDMMQVISAVKNETKINILQVLKCVDSLTDFQPIYKRTRGSHAAMILNSSLDVLSTAEDVGRHNALDKAIGKVFMERSEDAYMAILSSRISYEMVQKAARAGLAVVIGMSRPTALAVNLGKTLNMSLASVKKEGLMIFSGKRRFTIL